MGADSRPGIAQTRCDFSFLQPRTAARLLVSFILASTLCFVIYVYHIDDAGINWSASLAVLGSILPITTAKPDLSSTSQTQSTPIAAATAAAATTTPTAAAPTLSSRPPWIDAPAPFDTAQVPDYVETTALPQRPLDLHPRLARAMERFLARPVLTAQQARAQNEAACPRAQLRKQVNQDQYRSERAGWLATNASRIVEMRVAALEHLERRSRDQGREALIGGNAAAVRGSRGVVYAAGNHRTVERALASIKELRRLGWAGGVEVWHYEGELADAEKQRGELEALGVAVRRVAVAKQPGQWKNYELKAEAMARSAFDEVLYLDSDNFPLSDVTPLFDAPLFADPRGGRAVFWPDLNRDHPDNAIHRLLGVPCHDAWELDSGQVLISKSGNDGLNLAALELAAYMALDGYWFSGGDKDTFRYAFLALGIPYTPAPRWLALTGGHDTRGNFCGAGMLQYGITPARPEHADPDDPQHPEPLFAHANLVKHMNGVGPGHVFPLLRRLRPDQDDVRADYEPATALHSITGWGKWVQGRGLCSDIKAFRDGADVETLDTKEAFGGLMADFEDRYFSYGGSVGVWRLLKRASRYVRNL